MLPESLLRKALPVGLKFVLRFVFKAVKDYPNECEGEVWKSEQIDTEASGKYERRAAELSGQIRKENGIEEAIRATEDYVR